MNCRNAGWMGLCLVAGLAATVVAARTALAAEAGFAEVWAHAGKTSAVLYWQTPDISTAARSYVEYGDTPDYGQRTPLTEEARWAQLHWVRGLEPGRDYHFRTVTVSDGVETRGPDRTFRTAAYEGAVVLSATPDGSPLVLDRPGATYVLGQDIVAKGTAFTITAPDVTLELDGHKIVFAASTSERVDGIAIVGRHARILNGSVVQGDGGKDYSAACGSSWKANGLELAGLFLDVHGPNAHPLKLLGSAQGRVDLHHCHFHSTVTKIESRHYPGNALVRVDANACELSIHHNLLTEGCHRGITVGGETLSKSVRIFDNDIRHHARFVNGYAIQGRLGNGKIFRNRIASTGRAVHLTDANIEFYDNWCSTKGHMTLDDMPAKSGKWHQRRVELHGIKFEGRNARDCRVHHNFMKIVQPQPDGEWDYVPATPLNLACYDPNAMNEIYENTIIALTAYTKTRHGGYGDSGQWAAAIYFVGMNKGKSEPGKYSAFIHDNEFVSNDAFIGSHGGKEHVSAEHRVRIERNTFRFGGCPTQGHGVFYGIPDSVREPVLRGGNRFPEPGEGAQP
ncbi:MAG: fibronectin type III domain-containing protein [Kiritimatiellae bacterium]|nr:fibronectin type III domain-containing protein [Kiritimatiellia bacterium]